VTPQSFGVALYKRMFEVAPNQNPLSEANQHLYSAEPCETYQNQYGYSPSNKRNFPKKFIQKKSVFKARTDQNQENQKPIF
jgi:hypothetical protein